jgi:hypothetical protein
VIIFGEYFLPSASQKHLLKVDSATAKIIQIKYLIFVTRIYGEAFY